MFVNAALEEEKEQQRLQLLCSVSGEPGPIIVLSPLREFQRRYGDRFVRLARSDADALLDHLVRRWISSRTRQCAISV